MVLIENVTETEQLYTSNKRLLFSLAYRMLGSVMDAEDIVHEAFLSLNNAAPDSIRNVKAYLCKIVTNRCIDHLQAASKQREVYVGTWLPEPLVSDDQDSIDPMRSYLQKESITTSYLLLLQQLSTVERAVFLLREVLQFEYDEIADIVGKSNANCRQIFHRAKRGLAAEQPNHVPLEPLNEQTRRLVEQFMLALTTGDVGKLMNALTQDAALYTDGGGKIKASLLPIQGAAKIAGFLARFPVNAPTGISYKIAVVNGAPGVVMYANGQTNGVISLQTRHNCISGIYIVVNPDKLDGIR